MDARLRALSRRITYALRHKPDALGVSVDRYGYALIEDVLARLCADNTIVTREDLEAVVAHNDKARLAFDATGTRIRAVQGHSFPVDLGLSARTPPAVLFHGTTELALPSIRKHGLLPRSRQYLHLSANRETAQEVGLRHGKRRIPVVILEIDCVRALARGIRFYCAENGVWLCDGIPPQFLRFPVS